jgi:regulator of protease activity HflC (stomatin/prohibitin superfamily)
MLWFILSILFLLVAVGLALGSFASKEYSKNLLASAIGVFLLAVLVFALSGVREVPTKSVGVVTSFGRVGAIVTPGLHWMAPWSKVNILTTRIQTTTFEAKNCLSVRIGGQQEACLDATIQWHIIDKASPGLYISYGSNGGNVMSDVANAVVIREFKQAVNQQLGDYNPIVDVAKNGQTGNSLFTTFGPKVRTQMRAEIGQRIEVLTVIMPFLHYDTNTQNRLNTIQTQFADTAIANQELQTNLAQAKANDALARSVSHDPNVLIAQCLSLVQNAVKTNSKVLPAGFSCFGGSGTAIAVHP